MASQDKDRREPVLTKYELDPDARRLRDDLDEVAEGLVGLDGRTRRKALLLVGALAEQWSRQRPEPEERMSLRIVRSAEGLRIAASAERSALPQGFWEALGQAVVPGLADSWGTELGEQSGAWFLIARPA